MPAPRSTATSTNGDRLSSPRYGLTVIASALHALSPRPRYPRAYASAVLPMSLRLPSTITSRPRYLRVFDDAAQRRHAGRPELFEERSLRLDDRHERRDDVDHAVAKPRVRFRLAFQRVAAAVPDGHRQLLPSRVEPNTHGIAATANGVG